MADSAATIQARIDSINSTLARGVLTVSYEGKSVTYRSREDLEHIRYDLTNQLAALNGTPRPRRRFTAISRKHY